MNKEMMQRPDTEHWHPMRDLRSVTDMLADLLSPSRELAASRAWMPRVDVQETEKEYVITASLPGVKKEDVKVRFENRVLTISGERRAEKEEKDKGWLRRETQYGSFERSFAVPEGVHPEEVKAKHKDGLLTLVLPKPAQAKSRGLDVKVE